MQGKITFGSVVTFEEGEAEAIREIVSNVLAPASGKTHTREDVPPHLAHAARNYIRMVDSMSDQFRRVAELMEQDGMPEYLQHPAH